MMPTIYHFSDNVLTTVLSTPLKMLAFLLCIVLVHVGKQGLLQENNRQPYTHSMDVSNQKPFY